MPNIYKPKRKQQKNDNYYDSERRKIYNTERWRKLRRWKFINNPLCEKCLENGIVTPAEDVHHIVSFMSTDDPVQRIFLAYDYNNLKCLCKKCHQKEHNQRLSK